jgi:hypothetical protein
MAASLPLRAPARRPVRGAAMAAGQMVKKLLAL